ncbi:MAG: glutaredoxin family protein [Burkholderiaceae bacterium]|nr:glutaredoxin family protein [Burkholderiaceae bacterium]
MHSRPSVAAFSVALACTALAAALTAPDAHAQYKWVGPDGRVNYGDHPPPPDSRRIVRAPTGAHSSEAPAAGDHRLPYALRTATTRYPVVLYTTADCEPCDLGRAHLTKRGVPFVEKQVKSAADVKAFGALKFESTQFPALAVGSDRMVGFEASRWDRMLDAAAYPRSSMLPPNYLARTVEPMSPSATTTTAMSAGNAPAELAGSAPGAGGRPLPAREEPFENPIRF